MSHLERRGEPLAFDLSLLYGLRLLLMADLERAACSMSAVLCVCQRPLVASSPLLEVGTLGARVRTAWIAFYRV